MVRPRRELTPYIIHWVETYCSQVVLIDSGLRAEQMTRTTQGAIHDLLRASLAPEAYEKICHALTSLPVGDGPNDIPGIANSYKFCLFGEPSMDAPWGFNIFGRHACLNVFTLNGEIVIGPFSVNVNAGEVRRGSQLLRMGELAGLTLMRSLDLNQQAKACLQYTIDDLDGTEFIRTVGGAHQDNAIVPYKGICASQLNREQVDLLLDIVRVFNSVLPSSALERMMERVEEHLDETYFAWSGMVDDDSPYYFRVHSPVVLDELEHQETESLSQYRILATQRLPNRGDYGAALLDEWIRHSHARIRQSP